MSRLAAVIDAFEKDFLTQYRHKLSFDHLRALAAMKHCRPQSSLKMQVKCTECEHQMLVPHSCGHRHCPHCQHHESQQWLERQMKKQVPAEYFLMTFTLPAEFRALAFAQQGVLYALLMRCSWETVRTFSQNDKQLQGTPGAIAVLHTNTRRLDYHPHVHLIMPAGAQLRVSAPQLQAPDRLAAPGAEVRCGSVDGVDEGTSADSVFLLRGGDGDRANAAAVGVLRRWVAAHCHSGAL